jgi:hypothetical protein
MINNVRNTCLAIINKENRGFVTPEEFNRFAKMAQLEILEQTFYEYARSLVKMNQRTSNSEYADIPKNLREKIDLFSKTDSISGNSIGAVTDPYIYPLPSDLYRLENVYLNGNEVTEVPKKSIFLLNNSNLSAPSTTYPVYTRSQNNLYLYPISISSDIDVYYIRKPLDPKWTYTVVNNNPLFNPSAADYQDFEIHPSDEPKLIIKILSYMGVSIREQDIFTVAESMDNELYTKENN